MKVVRKRTAAGKRDFDFVAVLRATHGVDKFFLIFLAGESSGVNYSINSVGRVRLRNRTKTIVYSVRDNVTVGFAVHALVKIPQKLRNVMHGVAFFR